MTAERRSYTAATAPCRTSRRLSYNQPRPISHPGVLMERHIKARPDGNYQEIVRPGTMHFLDFARLQLRKGEKHSRSTERRECVLDIFSGTASVSIEGNAGAKK